MSAAKDPVGVTMRLIYKTILTEVDYYQSKTQESMKLMFALQKQIDNKLTQYFTDNPDQDINIQGAVFNRFGHFMRKVKVWREMSRLCWKTNTVDNRAKRDKARLEVEYDIKKYFEQRPDQSPGELTQLKFTQDLFRVDYFESQQKFQRK